MNLAKEVYFDENGNMVRSTRYKDVSKFTKVDNFNLNEELHLVNVGYQNSGAYFILKDDDDKTYYMSWDKFKEYLDKHDVVFNDTFTFYQQGTIRSIGLV